MGLNTFQQGHIHICILFHVMCSLSCGLQQGQDITPAVLAWLIV